MSTYSLTIHTDSSIELQTMIYLREILRGESGSAYEYLPDVIHMVLDEIEPNLHNTLEVTNIDDWRSLFRKMYEIEKVIEQSHQERVKE